MRVCIVADCGNRVVARGFCNRHYLRWSHHGDPLGGNPSPTVRVVVDHLDGTRDCTACRATLPLDSFDIDPNGTGGRRGHCKACRSQRMKDWYAANQIRQRDRQRERFDRNRDEIRVQDTERYRRHHAERLELAKQGVHRRRTRLRALTFDPTVSLPGLRVRDGDLCCYCAVRMTFESVTKGEYRPLRATVEHVIPISRGGPHTWDNTRLACWQCNVRKNARTVEEWTGADASDVGEAVRIGDAADLDATASSA